MRKLIVEEKEINDHKEIPKNIKVFYETIFKRNIPRTNVEKQWFLDLLNTETLTTNEHYDPCENRISETDLFDSMKSMQK